MHRAPVLAGKTGLKSLTCPAQQAFVCVCVLYLCVCIFAAMHFCFIPAQRACFAVGGCGQCCWYVAARLCLCVVCVWHSFPIQTHRPPPTPPPSRPFCRRCFMSTNRPARKLVTEEPEGRETDWKVTRPAGNICVCSVNDEMKNEKSKQIFTY